MWGWLIALIPIIGSILWWILRRQPARGRRREEPRDSKPHIGQAYEGLWTYRNWEDIDPMAGR